MGKGLRVSMEALTNHPAVRREQDFKVYVLSNQCVEVAVVPELGAKIISLKNRRTGREWMWHPSGGFKLFRNQTGDDFASSPLVGADECFPTIAPCLWHGRHLPDHGELWAAAWELNPQAWDNGLVKTSLRLKLSPFDFERTLELSENEIRLSYQLTNRSLHEEKFLWALHPLIRLQPADELNLPASTRAQLEEAHWVDAIDSAVLDGSCAKAFAMPVSDGLARIANRVHGDWLELEWDPAENHTLGIWLTRGGWHGHHHFALEPANGAPDALAVAATHECCGSISAGGTVRWSIAFRIGG